MSLADIFYGLGAIFCGVLAVGWHRQFSESYTTRAHGRLPTRSEALITRIGLGIVLGPMLIAFGVLQLFGVVDMGASPR
jgi:hypothetical protein